MSCVVPKESTLRPLLFLLYVNDVSQAFHSDLFLYFDDVSLAHHIKSFETIEKKNKDIASMCDWFVDANSVFISRNVRLNRDFSFLSKRQKTR